MRIANLVVVLGTVAGVTLAFFGCGTSRPNAANGEGTTNGSSESCSTVGDTRACKYILSESNGVRTCATGTEVCSPNGFWGACNGAGTAPSLLQSLNLNTTTNGGLQLQNVTPATDAGPACANPCDPACTGYNEACPDGGADAGDGGGSYFPPTTLPACGATTSDFNASCDCAGTAGATCGTYCNGTTGCTAYARAGKTASFRCNNVTGLCDFKCESGSTCNIECDGTSICSTTCATGSTCNIDCNTTGSCPFTCEPGATCNLIQCVGGSNCPRNAITANACYQAPPVNTAALGSLITPGVTPGFANKLFAACGSGNPSCVIGPFPAPANTADNGRMASACNGDSYCAGNAMAACCQGFVTAQTHGTQANSTLTCDGAFPDLTIKGACTLLGDDAILVCNRGNAPTSGPIWLGNESPAGDLPYNSGTVAAPTPGNIGTGIYPAGNWKCRYDAPIPAGACVPVSRSLPLGLGCAGAPWNGNKAWAVNLPNAPSSMTECTLNPKDAVNALQGTQPGYANNWSGFGANGQVDPCPGVYAPTKVTQEYTATCGPGQRPKWTTLGWQATVPTTTSPAQNTKIEFFATLQGTGYDGGPTTAVGPQLIGRAISGPNTATYVEGPGTCSPASPTTSPSAICPKDLAQTIGAPAPTGSGPNVLNYEKLTLDIFLYPTASGGAAPTLQNWWISYTCVDYE